MAAYYNEIDLYAAQWLRNLIAAGHIAPGDVDTRPIQEVQPDDIRKYTQCHFFAGIGGWSKALRLANWSDDRRVWSGSCPCQPFSSAGKQEGHADQRHLWPHWFRLIRECRPPIIFGEQVAGAIAFGWLDEVFNDLETENYACAASVLPACSVGRPHKRDRLWFVADSNSRGFKSSPLDRQHSEEYNSESCSIVGDPEHNGCNGAENRGGNAKTLRGGTGGKDVSEQSERTGDTGILSDDVADSTIQRLSERRSGEMGRSRAQPQSERCGALGNTFIQRPQRYTGNVESSGGGGRLRIDQLPHQIPLAHSISKRRCSGDSEGENAENVNTSGEGSRFEWIECPDGKVRPVEPSICLLAHGVPARVGRLRAYGNAIVPQVAAEFIKAYGECIE